MRKMIAGIILACACAGVLHADSLSISLTSKDPGNGEYGMERDAAIWIVDDAGAFVRTVRLWGADREDMLVWNASSGGNRVDAVSSATITTASQSLTAGWNGKNTSKLTVPRGTYWYMIQAENGHAGTGPLAKGKIVMDGVSKNRTGADTLTNNAAQYLTDIAVSYIAKAAVITPLVNRQISRSNTLLLKGHRSVTLQAIAINGAVLWQGSLPASGTSLTITGALLPKNVIPSGIFFLCAQAGSERVLVACKSIR
jgi:hypothetical protein